LLALYSWPLHASQRQSLVYLWFNSSKSLPFSSKHCEFSNL